MTEKVSRRQVLRGAGAAGAAVAGAGALAACGSSQPAATATSAAGSAASKAASGASSASKAASAGTTVPKSSVSVGGGAIVGEIVVTEPTAGQYKAFSAICTHEGCVVSQVQNNQILCACHRSVFDAATGAVTSGPARSALAAKTVTASGDNLVVS